MDFDCIKKELVFEASRSSGKGGQNVNKVSTKIRLHFDILASKGLEEASKQLILEKLKHRISGNAILQIVNQETRSQLKNKQRAIKKLHSELEKALYIPPKRKKVRKKRSAIEKRLQKKRFHAQKKSARRKVNLPKIDLFLVKNIA